MVYKVHESQHIQGIDANTRMWGVIGIITKTLSLVPWIATVLSPVTSFAMLYHQQIWIDRTTRWIYTHLCPLLGRTPHDLPHSDPLYVKLRAYVSNYDWMIIIACGFVLLCMSLIMVPWHIFWLVFLISMTIIFVSVIHLMANVQKDVAKVL